MHQTKIRSVCCDMDLIQSLSIATDENNFYVIGIVSFAFWDSPLTTLLLYVSDGHIGGVDVGECAVRVENEGIQHVDGGAAIRQSLLHISRGYRLTSRIARS